LHQNFFKTAILANTNKHMLRFLFIPFFVLLAVLLQAQQRPAAAQPEKGKLLAKPCMDCHVSPGAALADPLKGIRKIRTSGYIYNLMKNPMRFADENKIAKKVFAKRGLQMPPFPNLSNEDIKAILDYFDSIPNKKN
jgi:cytochrome c1